ncbi:MAG TPA: restriction endonuclease subunit S [Ktedonobacteraceae bacterium]
MENELPEGWVWTTFSELITLSQNGYGKRSSNEGNFTIVLKLSDIHKDAISLENTRKIKLTNDEIENYQLLENDLVCIRVNGSRSLVGRIIRFRISSRDPITFCDHFIRFRPANAELAAFLSLYFETKKARQHIELNMVSSAGQNTVSQGTIISVDVPVPPLPEQRRIVAAIEQQFSRLDAAVTSLQHARAKLKRQRAAILKAAIEGTLTTDWRTQHSASETAEQLLQRILHERRAKWEAEQLAKMQARGVTPKDDSWKEGYKEPEPPDTTNLPELSEGWVWTTVEQVGNINEQVVLTGPFGSNLGRGDFVDSGVPVLTIGCLTEHGLSLEKAFYISEEKASELERYKLREGDILFSRMASVGRADIVSANVAGAIINYHLMRLRLETMAIDSDYFIDYVRGSKSVVEYIKEVNHGVTRDGINTNQLLSLPIALPPLTEQQQIVSEAEARLSILAQTELEVEANLKRAGRLRQTILAQAFAGRLVHQDPDDEPASVLLERIRQERGERDEMQKKEKGKAGNGRARAAMRVPDKTVKIDVEGMEQVVLWESVGG